MSWLVGWLVGYLRGSGLWNGAEDQEESWKSEENEECDLNQSQVYREYFLFGSHFGRDQSGNGIRTPINNIMHFK